MKWMLRTTDISRYLSLWRVSVGYPITQYPLLITYTLYPIEICTRCVWLCYCSCVVSVVYSPIFFRVASLAMGQLFDWLPQWQLSKHERIVLIDNYFSTTKHWRVPTVCTVLGTYCSMPSGGQRKDNYSDTTPSWSSHQNLFEDQGPLLLTWFNFNPSMDK